MKAVIALLIIVCICPAALSSVSPAVNNGDIVIVRGFISECPGFPGILGHVDLGVGSQLQLLSLPPIQARGATAAEIHQAIAKLIAAARDDGKAPASLRVQIFSSNEFHLIKDELLASYSFLARGLCNNPPYRKPPLEQQRELLQVKWRRIA